jgi:MFS family permease
MRANGPGTPNHGERCYRLPTMPLALFPAIAEGWGGAKAMGLLTAAPAMGALVTTLTSRWTPRVHRHGLAVMLAATVWGLAIVVFGFAGGLVPAVLCLAVAGGADCVSGLFRMTLWNQTIPGSFRGRLAGIEMVSYMSGPLLGNAEAGLVAKAFNVKVSVISGGVLCVIGVAACALLLPRFVGYDARAWKPREEAPDGGCITLPPGTAPTRPASASSTPGSKARRPAPRAPAPPRPGSGAPRGSAPGNGPPASR